MIYGLPTHSGSQTHISGSGWQIGPCLPAHLAPLCAIGSAFYKYFSACRQGRKPALTLTENVRFPFRHNFCRRF